MSRVANQWLTNGQTFGYQGGHISATTDQNGNKVKVPPKSGFLEMRLKYCFLTELNLSHDDVFPADRVKSILIDNVSIGFEDVDGDSINTDDYSFRSYINKNVKSDLGEITLKCISANEEMAPVGKANILRKSDNGYSLQLAYTRSGQTDILERLLMCSIHSNFSRKNERFSVTSKIAGNPALSHITYSPVLSGEYLVNGCELDFRAGKVRISAVGYSEDTAKLTDIPYD